METLKLTRLTDHELAAYLAKRQALDDVTKVGNANMWRDPQGVVVAVVFYHGVGGMDTSVYILRE